MEKSKPGFNDSLRIIERHSIMNRQNFTKTDDKKYDYAIFRLEKTEDKKKK